MGSAKAKEYGRRIRYWRERLGLMQRQLGDLIGVGQSTVATWETGYAAPKLETLSALAEACGLSMAQFWGPMEEPPDPDRRPRGRGRPRKTSAVTPARPPARRRRRKRKADHKLSSSAA